MAVIPAFQAVTPEVAPRRFGLLSVIDFTDSNDARFLAGVDFESKGCVLPVGFAAALCEAQTPKTITDDDAPWSKGFAFTSYILRECRAVGQWEEFQKRAGALYAAAEQNGIEQALWAYLTAVDTDVTDVTPTGGAVTPEIGVALLEGWAGKNYSGDPVIHAPRAVGSTLGTKGVMERHGNKMETTLGATVVSGGGYSKVGPNLAAEVAGESWLFATGQVVGWRGQMIAKGPFMVQSPRDNTAQALAERPYALAVDCGIAAVRVTHP